MAQVPAEPKTPCRVKSDAQPNLEDPDEYQSACNSFGESEDFDDGNHTTDNGTTAVVLLSMTQLLHWDDYGSEVMHRRAWMARRKELRQLHLSEQRLMDVRHMFAQVAKRHDRQLHKHFLQDFSLS